MIYKFLITDLSYATTLLADTYSARGPEPRDPASMLRSYLLFLVMRPEIENWARNHEGDTIAYLKAHVRVHTFIRIHPHAAAELISRTKGIPSEIAARIIAKVRWDAALYTKDMNALQRLHQENDMPSTVSFPSSNEIRFKGEYLQQAIKALKLPHLSSAPLEGDWAVEQFY